MFIRWDDFILGFAIVCMKILCISNWFISFLDGAKLIIFIHFIYERMKNGTDSLYTFFFCDGCSDDEAVYQDDQSEFDTGFGNIIVVDHLPVVPKEKFEKLEGVVKKIYNQLGVIKENGLWMPVDPDTKMTLGYCFIEFNTPQVIYLLD